MPPDHPHSPPLRPWSRLTDAEYAALQPYVTRPAGPGRPLRDPRGRLDAIFRICLTNLPWSRISTDQGPTATIHRHFRRWARAGVWTDLLKAAHRRRAPKAIRRMRTWICAIYRRCLRILGLAAVHLARRLNAWRAIPGPVWYFPDPDLSESIRPVLEAALTHPDAEDAPLLVALCRRVLRVADGRRAVPRCLVPVG